MRFRPLVDGGFLVAARLAAARNEGLRISVTDGPRKNLTVTAADVGLVVPGTVAAINYSRTFCVLADHPDMAGFEAMKRSSWRELRPGFRDSIGGPIHAGCQIHSVVWCLPRWLSTVDGVDAARHTPTQQLHHLTGVLLAVLAVAGQRRQGLGVRHHAVAHAGLHSPGAAGNGHGVACSHNNVGPERYCHWTHAADAWDFLCGGSGDAVSFCLASTVIPGVMMSSSVTIPCDATREPWPFVRPTLTTPKVSRTGACGPEQGFLRRNHDWRHSICCSCGPGGPATGVL
jgi:hypothetical protein